MVVMSICSVSVCARVRLCALACLCVYVLVCVCNCVCMCCAHGTYVELIVGARCAHHSSPSHEGKEQQGDGQGAATVAMTPGRRRGPSG